tara:strand:+ start:754 stop:1773 length:1020 start_codon:yes stop_codon:yes gene_type:complete
MWKGILKVQPLLDTSKLRDALGFIEAPIDLMYEFKRRMMKPSLMILGEKEGELNEEYEMTRIELNNFDAKGKKMVLEGEYTLEKLGDFTFQAIYTFDKNLVAMSSLPNLDRKNLTILTDDKFKKLTRNNSYNINRDFRGKIGYAVFAFLEGSFDDIFEYDSEYVLTGPRLSRDKDLERDKRGKQERFKEVLRKPDSSNLKEFDEVMNSGLYTTALPVDKNGAPNKALKRLIEKGIVIEKEEPKEEYKYEVSEQNRVKVIDGIPIRLYFSESLYGGGEEHFLEIEDNLGEYPLYFYAQLDIFNEPRKNQYSSRERQEIIDAAKKFSKMSGKQILDEILRM